MEIGRDSVLRRHGLTPTVILDGGGEGWDILGKAIDRCTREMMSGQLLEVISLDPAAGFAIPPWCHEAGHYLVAVLSQAPATHFWIKKQ